MADNAPGRSKRPFAVGKVTATGLKAIVGDIQDFRDRPLSARPLWLGQRRGHIRLADTVCDQRQFFGVAESLKTLGLDIRQELLEAVASAPLAAAGEPVEVCPPVLDRPQLLLRHGSQNVGIVDLDQVGTTLERRADGRPIIGISLDEAAEFVFIRSKVGQVGGVGGRRQHADEPRHDLRRPNGHQQAGELTIEIKRAGRKDRRDLFRDPQLHLGRWVAEPHDGQLAGTGEFEPALVVECLGIEAIEGGEHRRLIRRLALPRHGDRGGDSAHRFGDGQRRVAPDRDRLVLDRNASRIADEPVGMGEVWDRLRDGDGRILDPPVERLKFLTQLPIGGPGGIVGIHRGGRFRARIPHSEQFAVTAAATDGEVEAAIARHRGVGQGQGSAGQKLLLPPHVGRTLGLEVDRVHRPERPITGEERLLVLRRKRRPVAKRHAHGRAGADVDKRWQAVGIPRWPVGGTAAPAELAAARCMVDPRGAVPRHPEVPLHVGVVDKQFAIGVESHVVGVAVAGRPDIPLLPVAVGAHDVASRREDADGVAVGVPHPRDDLVLVPVRRESARGAGRQRRPPLIRPDTAHRLRFGDVGHLKRQLGVVAADHEQPLAVGRWQNRVRAMLACAFETAELLDAIRHVVAVGVGDAVEPTARASVADDVQRVECPEQTLRGSDRRGDPLDFRDA